MAYPATMPADVAPGDDILASWGDDVRLALNFLANRPACLATDATVQSLVDATETTIDFDLETFDTDTMHNPAANNSRITFTTAGLYQVTFNGLLASAADYARILAFLRLNGVTEIGGSSSMSDSAAIQPRVHACTVRKFAAADYVEVRVFQDNTANAARDLSGHAFSAVWLGNG